MAMIYCPECHKEMSTTAFNCPHCGTANKWCTEKRVSGLLIAGIVFFPIIFSWFTLAKGYSTKARAISFGWLVLLALLFTRGDSERLASTDPNVTMQKSVTKMHTALKNVEKPIPVAIKEILSAYEANEVAADTRYKGKLIEVTGRVGEIKKNIVDDLYVTLGTGNHYESKEIQAFFEDDMNDKLASLKKGDQLTVICRVDGLMWNVHVSECKIK